MPPADKQLLRRLRRWLQAVPNWLADWYEENQIAILVTGLCGLFLLVYLSPRIFITISSGQAGVLFKRFGGGTREDVVYGEGFHVVSPWDVMTIYNTRLQVAEYQFSAIASNGLSIDIGVSIRYKPKLLSLPLLHKEVGPEYVEDFVKPEVQAEIRDLVSRYSAEQIYSTERKSINRALGDFTDNICQKYLLVDNLLITSITLPPTVQEAIQTKAKQEQMGLEMKFRIDQTTQEAQRKLIEAKGVQAAQELIGQNLTEQILKYNAIEAMLELAKSDNAKVVILGGQSGVPFMAETAASSMLDYRWKAGTNWPPSVNATNRLSLTNGLNFLNNQGATNPLTNP